MSITITDLSYSYPGGAQALRALSCSLPLGITGIIGGNGAGKSTLFKLLAGHVRAEGIGMIQWNNSTMKPDAIYIPEHHELPEFLTAREIINAVDSTHRLPTDLSDALGLSEFSSRLVRECSLGMRKRLVLSLAFSRPRPIILLDEPFSGIDVDTLQRLHHPLKKFIHQGARTLLVASHQLDVLHEICDSILVMHSGHQLFFGSVDQLLKQTMCTTLFRAYDALKAKSKDDNQ